MQKMACKTTEACQDAIVEASLDSPGLYCGYFVDFGQAYLVRHKRLGVFAPTTYPCYALNGKLKQFTERQRVADQNATPALS